MDVILLTLMTLLASAAGDTSGESSDSSSSSHGQQQRPHKPHIVYFLADNWDEIGYQDPFYITPFMDELAANGIKLTHFYTAISCTPSRSRLMTGKHEVRYGMQTAIIFPSTPYGLPLYLKTLPDRLRELGYSTHQIGKWHLGHHRPEYTPLYRGFDTFYGYYNGAIDYYTHGFCCPLSQCNIDFGYDMRDQEEIVPIREIDGVYDSFIFTAQSNQIIDRQDPQKPMFLLFSSHGTHQVGGIKAPQKYIDLYLDRVEGMDPAEALQRSRKGAKATIVDDMVRNLVTTLKENGLWENTIFILTTDNGQSTRPGSAFMLPWVIEGRDARTEESSLKGPAFVHSPLFPKEVNGTVIDELTSIMDMFPTILNMAGDHVDPSTTDGVDLWDMLINGAPATNDELLQVMDQAAEKVGESMFPDSFDTSMRAAIRVGDYKLVTGCDDYLPTTWDNGTYLEKGCRKFWHDHHRNYFLYNIREDPREENDLADDPAHYDRIVHMVDRLKWWDDQSVPPLFMHPEAWSTVDACPSNNPENVGRTYKYFGPYQTGEDWQLSTPRKEYISPF